MIIFTVAKVFLLILLGMYIIFALVVYRQVKLMTDTLEVGFEKPLKIVALIHLLLALATLVTGTLIL